MSVWWLKTSIYRQILLLLHVYHPSPKTCNGLSHLISTPLSLCWGYMFLKSIPWRIALSKTWTSEELQSQKPEPLKNCSLKNLNPWRIAVSKTRTPEELQPQKPEPLRIPVSKTWTPEELQSQKPEPLRNSSLKNLNPWRTTVSKTWTPEDSSLKNLNPWGFQSQNPEPLRIPVSKTWTPEDSSLKNLNPLRNSSFKNLKPWIIPVFKILTLEEFQPQVVSQPLRNSILLSFRLSTVYQPFIFRF